MLKRKERSDKITISKKDLRQIETMAGLGFNQKQICSVLDISVDTLRRRLKDGDQYLSAVVTKGKTEALSKVAKKAYSMAVSGNTGMIKYFLNCQGGWSEKQQISLIDEIEVEDNRTLERENLFAKMNRDELDKYEELLAQLVEIEEQTKKRMSVS
jgi:hypothetical protein